MPRGSVTRSASTHHTVRDDRDKSHRRTNLCVHACRLRTPHCSRRQRQRPQLCCSLLQCVVVCCSVLQCSAVWGSVGQCRAVNCGVLQCGAVCCSVSRCVLSWFILGLCVHAHTHICVHVLVRSDVYVIPSYCTCACVRTHA